LYRTVSAHGYGYVDCGRVEKDVRVFFAADGIVAPFIGQFQWSLSVLVGDNLDDPV